MLSGYRILKRRSLLITSVSIALVSALFSATALSLLGIYSTLTSYASSGEGYTVIYSTRSSTPFTGYIPSGLSHLLCSSADLPACSPEVLVPAVVKGRVVFVRGVDPSSFSRLTGLDTGLSLRDPLSVDVGIKVAEELNVSPGDRLVLGGVLSREYVVVRVEKVLRTGTLADYEIVAPLYVAQWLRGCGYGYVTFIRVPSEGNRSVVKEAVKAAIRSLQEGNLSHGPPRPPASYIISRKALSAVNVSEAYNFMERYLRKYGVSRSSLLSLAILVLWFSSGAVAASVGILLAEHREVLGSLRAIGASRRRTKLIVALRILPFLLVSSLAGLLMSFYLLRYLSGKGLLTFLGYGVEVSLDPDVVALDLTLVPALALAAVALGDAD